MKTKRASAILVWVLILTVGLPGMMADFAQAGSGPAGWLSADINGSLPEGNVAAGPQPGDYVITAGGADIWGTADQFYYAYRSIPVSGDFTAIVEVESMERNGTAHEWGKAGIMARQNLEPGSPHTMAIRSVKQGAALQGRDIPNGESWNNPLGGGYGPGDTVWLRLDRVDNTFTGSYLIGGEMPPTKWMASSSHEVAMPPDILVGLATTSHEQGVPIEVAYSDFCIGPYLGPPVLAQPELPDSPAGSEGYVAIQEVVDNGPINDQGACYASLILGTGSIAGHWKPVLNLWDSGGNGHYGNDALFAVVDLGYRQQGSVDDLSLIARGTIRIPPGQGGEWTFGVNSDDGFTLQFPRHSFTSAVNGELVNFASGTALRFYGGRATADTLGVIDLPAGAHPFWLTYHEGGGDAAVELYAAKGAHTSFNQDVFRLVGHKSIGTVHIPGFCNEVIMTASRPGAWSRGQIDSVQDALDALAEGQKRGTNSIRGYVVVNHSDPEDGAADPDVSGSFPADLVFPNNKAGDDNDFAVMVEGLLDIPMAGTYQIGFNSDDGALIRIFGHQWKSIVPGSDPSAVIVGDQLITDVLTGWSFTAGEIEFSASGCYEFRAVMFERGGGSFFELFGRGISRTTGKPDPSWHLLKMGGAGMIQDSDGLQLVAPPVAECFPSTYPGYQDWLALGKPDCWCKKYQCDGDVDGGVEGIFKYRVYGKDLALIVANWKKKIDDPTLNPCADIDHKGEGVFKYRVYGKDLARVVSNWKKKDADLPGTCPRLELTIGGLKSPGWEKYIGEIVTVEGIFVRDPLPMLVTDLDIVKVNMPMPEDKYIVLVGNNAWEVDPAVYGGAKLRVTGPVKPVDDPDNYVGEYVAIQVAAYELLERRERYNPTIILYNILPAILQPNCYAILFSGGIDSANNHIRYWNDLKFMYSTLVNEYRYSAGNITVLYADGKQPKDPTTGKTDTQIPVHYSATQANLQKVFNLLKALIWTPELIFVFTTNHGGGFEKDDLYSPLPASRKYCGRYDAGGDEPATDVLKEADYKMDLNGDGDKFDQVAWDEELCSWGGSIFDDAFPNMFANLKYNRMVIVMEQCFSGGLIWDMRGTKRVIMSAAGEYEFSEAMYPYDYDEFSYYSTCAVNGADPDGKTVDADTNKDGQVSMVEAFNYATSKDTRPETPWYEDSGDGVPHSGSMPSGGDGTLGSNTAL